MASGSEIMPLNSWSGSALQWSAGRDLLCLALLLPLMILCVFVDKPFKQIRNSRVAGRDEWGTFRWVVCLCNHYRWEAVRVSRMYESVQSVVEPHHSRASSCGVPAVQLSAVWPYVPAQVRRTTTHGTRSRGHLQTTWPHHAQTDHHSSLIRCPSVTATAATSFLLTAANARSLGVQPSSIQWIT